MKLWDKCELRYNLLKNPYTIYWLPTNWTICTHIRELISTSFTKPNMYTITLEESKIKHPWQ